MPIRFVDKSATISGRVTATLGSVTTDFDGTFTAAPSRTGSVASLMQNHSSAFVGQFQANANRVGTIGVTLAGATASFVGSGSLGANQPGTFSVNPWRELPVASAANPFKNSAGFGGAKHVSFQWHPTKKRVYTFGGDFDSGPGNFGQPEPGGLFTTNAPSGAQTWRASSGYRQDQYSIDPYATSPASWRLEHPFRAINQSGTPETRPPVNCQSALVWDSNRSKFWGIQTFIRGWADLQASSDPQMRYASDPWAGGTTWSTGTEPSGTWSWVPGSSGSPGVWTRETTNALVYRQGASTATYEGTRLVTGAADERICDFAYSTQHDVIAAISSYVGTIKLWIFRPNTLTWEHRTIPTPGGYSTITTTSSQIAILGDWIYAIGISQGPNRSVLLRANLTNGLALSNGGTLTNSIGNVEAFTLPSGMSLSEGGVWEASGDYSQKWPEHAGVEAIENKIIVAITYDSIIDGSTTKLAAFVPSNKTFYVADNAPEDIVANAWVALPDTAEIFFGHSSPAVNYKNSMWAYRVSHLGPLAFDQIEILGSDNLPGSAPDPVGGGTYVVNKPREWMYSMVTKDGTILRFGDDGHGQSPPQWNSVREFNPVTGVCTTTYANNFTRADVSRENNQPEFYIPTCNYAGATRDLFIRSPSHDEGIFDRGSGTWLAGNLPPASNSGRHIVGTQAIDLMYRDSSISGLFANSFNPHFAWSTIYNCGIFIGGSPGTNDAPRPAMWLMVPSNSSINTTAVSQGNPFTIYEKGLPSQSAGIAQWGEPPQRMRAAMACAFAGDYVYWFGGDPYGDNVAPGPFTSKALFRMNIVPHLTSKTVSLTSGAGAIQRLTDGPVNTNFGLMTYDAYLNCLVVWCGSGSSARIYAYDLTYPGPDGVGTWVNVTPPNWTAAGLFGGDSVSPPLSCQGGYVDRCGNTIVRKHVFSPGLTSYGATNMETFFGLRLKRY